MPPSLPPEQLITIARNCVRKYRSEQSSEFEDFRQEVLLRILERQMFFNSELGTVKRFVITVAQQAAKRCEDELRIRLKQAVLNPRTRLPTSGKIRDAEEADEFGLLVQKDESLNFVQLTVFLSEEATTVLLLRLSHCSCKKICPKLCITKNRYAEILNGLKAWVNDFFANEKKLFPFKGSDLHY